jgi:alpha-beta hydrolase superfamily lysophospholipase
MSRLDAFPRSLRARTTLLKLGDAPALVTLPEATPVPLLLWLHGRTADKEIDGARYLRLLRAGIATCAFDLPGHGERTDLSLQAPSSLPELLEQTVGEIDGILAALRASRFGDRIRWDALALGGMSAGGMAALRRLCDDHPFRCAAVESTAGDFEAASGGKAARDRMIVAALRGLDPVQHLDRWRPIPFLALHSEADQVVPVAGITSFVRALRDRYAARGSDAPVTLHTWPETGAPREHAGFGKRSGEARALLIEFLTATLGDDSGG